MATEKTQFVCQSCGNISPKWMGKCSNCNNWNSYIEEKHFAVKKGNANSSHKQSNKPILLHEVQEDEEKRLQFADAELNRIFGNGLVLGSLVLFAGEPGIGKSTLMLQAALSMHENALYVSGEESEKQIKLRATRLNETSDKCYISTETCMNQLENSIDQVQPKLIVVDSIQTVYSQNVDAIAGNISQIKECAQILLSIAKSRNIPIIIIGHINKEGNIAGPKILEHLVDTVIQFEGEKNTSLRIVRCLKNRFGNTNETAIYEMKESGLQANTNPSKVLLSHLTELRSGIAIASACEGSRSYLVEVQSLVSSAVYGTPQRSTTGYDTRRLNMILAVLEKRCGFRLSIKDVFLNIAGGFHIEDTSIDLAVACSVLSSNEDIPIPYDIAIAGEIGLTGEIRPVQKIEKRLIEAEKMGLKRMIVSAYNKQDISTKPQIEIIYCNNIEQVFGAVFG